MKKLIGIMTALAMLFSVMLVDAKVKYFEKDGKWFATVTYTNSGLPAVNIIGSMTDNWAVPGVPMTLNAEGVWEYTFEMNRPKEQYKFYDPAKSGEAAYIEDPEAEDAVANPFGSKNAILKRPGKGGTAAAAEESYPKLNFGLWSRTYYWVKFGSNLSVKSYNDKDGNYKETRLSVEDPDLAHKWKGEYGSTDGNVTRVWLSDTKFRSSNTAKVHGKVMKHMTLDVEMNLNASVTADYTGMWDKTTENDRYDAVEEVNRSMSSQFIGLLFGPLSKNGTWGRWVGTKTSDWDTNNNATWIDQIVVSFPFDDLEVKLGVLGNNSYRSKDPMMLLSGKRTGDKEDIATNLEFLIHPKALKGFNAVVGTAHAWRDETKDDTSTWSYSVDSFNRKYMGYLDLSYSMKMIDFGAMSYFNSWSPTAIDALTNSYNTSSAWAVIKPITGLSISLQGAVQTSTRYYDSTDENDSNSWAKFRTREEGYDFLANSAAFAEIKYALPSFITIGYTFATAGTMFEGTLAAEDSRFAGWDDSDKRVNGVTNYSSKLPYYYAQRGAQISNQLDFSINPMKNDLLKIKYHHDFVIGKLDGLDMDEDYDNGDNANGRQANKYQIDNMMNPGLESTIGNISLGLGATFSVTTYQDETLVIDGDDDSYQPTTYFTFNKATASVGVDKISDILKSASVEYKFEMNYYSPFYGSTTQDAWDVMKNSIQYKNFYNQVMATMKFSHDISLGLGFIIRNYRGDQSDSSAINYYSNELIDKMSDDVANDLSTYDQKKFKRVYNANMYYYMNGGFALQFKYVIPVEEIMKPTFFANVGLCWDPFDDDGDTTMDFKNDQWDTNTDTYQNETSVIAVGMQWDF